MGLLDKLLGRNKKRSQADETIKIMDDAIQFAAEKWAYFTETVPFKDSVPLKERIFAFTVPATEGLKNNFSPLKNAPEPIYLVIIAKGVELSGTHSKAQIEEALGVRLP
jgi:hypothetical protein